MSKPADDSINKHLHYDRPIFTDQVMPKGELTLEPLCHACWYYLMLAQKNKEQVGKGPESQIITVDTWSSEKPLWHEKRYKAIAKRSEEHTSELQSLMRNSYAVFCLKKKKKCHNTEQKDNR